MNSEEIDNAIKETFKTKIEQKLWMYNFQEILKDLEKLKLEEELIKTRMESFFDMIGMTKISKQKWREKYILSEKDEQVRKNE